MYPRFSDMLNDLFGTDIRLPMQTFGFFMACAFVAAYFVIRRELRRREKAGHFTLRLQTIEVSGPISLTEVLIHCIIWGAIGYKLGLMVKDYTAFYENPQKALFSAEGWIPGIFIGMALGGGLKIWRYIKSRGEELVTKEVQIGPSWYMNIILTLAFVFGILGSKIFAWLEGWDAFIEDPIRSLFSFDGLSFYGGLLTAGFVICWFAARRGFHVLTIIDAFGPGLILAYSIGRIGCHMSGDGDWGVVNLAAKPEFLAWLPDWAWAYDYPHNVVSTMPAPNLTEIDCLGQFCYKLSQPVWPTSIYEFIMGMGIFGILMAVRKKLRIAGQLTAVYMALIGAERMLIEQIRVNEPYHFLGLSFTQAEAISFGMIASAIALWLVIRKKGRRFPEGTPGAGNDNLPAIP